VGGFIGIFRGGSGVLGFLGGGCFSDQAAYHSLAFGGVGAD